MKNETNSRPFLILLIEDNEADIGLMKRALDQAKFGYELRSLNDGAVALAFIRREGKHARAALPAPIVTDLHLPKKDRIEILTEIRGSAAFAEIPVVVLSASFSGEEKDKAAVFKATTFIPKPRELEECLTVAKRSKQLALDGKASVSGARA